MSFLSVEELKTFKKMTGGDSLFAEFKGQQAFEFTYNVSVFAASPPVVDPDAAAVSMVWGYVGEQIFNMLILVGTVKMADRVVREMMGL